MQNLLRLIGRRLVAFPFMVIGVTILVFLLTALNPVDQAYSVLGETAGQDQIDKYRADNNLDKPLIVQYFIYLGNLLQGDLGTYGANNASVAERVAEALPVTLQLTFAGLLVGLSIALLLGILSAIYRDTWLDQVIRVLSVAAIATPSFWLAVLLIMLFSSTLHMFPASGDFPNIFVNPGGWASRMVLPTISLAVPLAGQMTRIIRTSMVEELDSDYVRTAIGSGIPYRVVVARNVLRNALITPVTVLGLRVGYMIGGAVVIEVIYNLPGMGMAIMAGIQSNFTALVQGVVLVVAIAFIIINIVIDLLYILIDPRIRSV